MLPERSRIDAVSAVADLVDQERDRIVRLWAKRLRAELQEVEVPGRDVRAPLAGVVGELARMLRDRGEEALVLWPEMLRAHAIRRYDQRYNVEDLGRELKTLHVVLLRVYARRHGTVDPDAASFLAELIGEASAAMHAAYVRVLRTEDVRFREAAVMESVLHHVDVGILLAESDGTVTFATPPVARLTGLPVRALLGAKGDESLSLALEQLEARRTDGEPFRPKELPYLRALAEKREIYGVQMAIRRFPDGKEMILEMNAIPLFEAGRSEPYGAIQTLSDRTETARQQRELQRLAQRSIDSAHALNNVLNVAQLRIGQLRKGTANPNELAELDRSLRQLTGEVAVLQQTEDASVARIAPPGPSEGAGGSRQARGKRVSRVLVVDDDHENALVMAEVLGAEGYRVQVAHDAASAMELWRTEPFDAALLDARMPGKSGWDLAREIRGESPKASIAIVTGDDVRGQSRECLSLVDAVFRKPVEARALDEFLSSERSVPAS